MRAHTHTHKQENEQASKLFLLSLCLYDYSSLYQPSPPFPSSLHTHDYIQRIVRGPVVLLALLLASAFSLYFLLLLQSPFAITYTADGDEHTYTHTKQSRALLTHIHGRYNVCALCLKKRSETRKQRHTHTYTHIHVMCVRFLSLSILPFS